MLRVLLIPAAAGLPTPWPVTGFSVERAPTPEEGIARLKLERFDVAVLIAAPGGDTREWLERMQAVTEAEALPLALAADAADETIGEVILGEAFDAFIDLRWGVPLVERTLMAAVARARAGRGLATIQRQVLEVIRGELTLLRERSVCDELTGLFNYRHFREVHAREHQRCLRHSHTYALVLFDVDNLRDLNNTFGHAVGSRALERVGWALASSTRRSDFAFRTGGDEFAALLVDTGDQGARLYAERIRLALKEALLTDRNVDVSVSVSVGIASFPLDGQSEDELLRHADEALYRAKDAGRNRIAVFSESA